MINKLRFHFNALYNRIIWKLKKKPIVKSIDETLDYINEQHCFVSRYGDGEFTLIDVEYEWFLQSALDKCIIKNKYVNEVDNREVSDLSDPEYQDQVISVIK